MRLIILSIITLTSLLFSAQIRKEYDFTTPVVRNGVILMNNCYTAESEWAPSVAVHAVQLMLPLGETVVSCNIEYYEPTLLNGSFYIKPAVPPTPISHGPVVLKRALDDAYSTDSFFPSNTRKEAVYNIQYKNGIGIINTTIRPSQFNPISKKIRYYKNVVVTVETATAVSAPKYYCTPAIKSSVKTLVQNPEAVDMLPLSVSGKDDYEYLIACMTSLKDSFGDFIKFNTRRGMRTKVFTVDDVKSGTGSDIQDKLRNLIIDEYKNFNIKYVLIVSNDVKNDSKCIPHRGFWSKFYDHDVEAKNLHDDNDIPADMYFGCLDGDWKTDKSGVVRDYGFWETEDIPSEVYVGRFCVSSATHLKNIIKKIIGYSEKPVKDNAIKNVMLAGEFLWDDFGVVCTGSKSLTVLKGANSDTVNGFVTHGFPENDWNFTEVKHEDNSNWWKNKQNCKSLFYEGIGKNKCSWVDHNGHASTDFSIGSVTSSASAFGNQACMGVLSENFWSDCNGVASNFFFMTSGGCYSGAFDRFCPPGSGLPYEYSSEDCWAAVVTRMATGPVAMIGNSRFGMGDNDGTDGPSDRPIRWIHDAMFNPEKKIHYVGHMLANAKETDMKRITLADVTNHDITKDDPYFGALKYTNYELNLFGDPALSLWTDDPKELNINPVVGLNKFTVDTKGAYSWIALADKDDKIFITQQTGIDGKCSISDDIYTKYISENNNGKIKVYVKSHNYLPKVVTIDISTGISNNINLPVKNFNIQCGKNYIVNFSLLKPGFVDVKLYNSKGVVVKSLVNKTMDKGNHAVTIIKSDISSGIYYCRYKGNNTQKLISLVVNR